ncbi:hypothetical protein LAD12857_26670 [Lacrimispora amygdalina]|uniref:N-acetyltransferase domain-containing protein n=1 Tax=Lacrimispora amygdalina TaxID=253257 RepID=A0A3E2N5A3_9FIRM|nr:hypothetical protein [Clostridium indicum]RFZ76144.1 hypothetical protein DS742_25315 [Clostridium indicum]
MVKERKVKLKNKNGDTLLVLLREYRKGDEEGMIACIRDEYGETYFKRDFYDPEYIKSESDNHHIKFLAAQTEDKEIAGMMILKQFYPEESMCEIASQIFRKKYRGYGLALPFFQYGLELLKARNYSAAYCLPVTFHHITQVLLYRSGLRAAGFILNVFDLDKIIHSYKNGRNTKHSQAIQIMALDKRDAGTLYLPVEHQKFAGMVYESLGVNYSFHEEKMISEWGESDMPDYSDMTFSNDAVQSNLEIRVLLVGRDFKKRLLNLHRQFPLCRKQTASLFLNCNDCHAVKAYEILKKMGYFFTGLKPLCSEKEYMVLHNPGKVQIYFDDYMVSSEFASLLLYVKYCYERSQNMVFGLGKDG